MARFQIVIAKSAAMQINKLEKKAQITVAGKVEALAVDPRPTGVEKLSESPKFWRLKSGNYRVIYHVDDDQEIVTIALVRHRRDAYRNLGQLNIEYVRQSLKPHLTHLGARMNN
jgi:mRNA interferase RelE/StbE